MQSIGQAKANQKVKPKPRISKVKKIQERTCWVVVTDEKMSKNVTQDVFSSMMDAELLVKWMRSWSAAATTTSRIPQNDWDIIG